MVVYKGARKNYRRPNKKRIYKRRYNRKYNRNGVVNAISPNSGQLPLPNTILVRHRYVQQCTLNATSGSASTYTFSLNGLYDPDVNAIGHQPMGFDQFAALYQNYKVLGVKFTARFICDDQSTSTPQFVGIQFHENASYSPSTYDQILERGRCVSGHLSGTSATPYVIKSMKWSGKKWFSKMFLGGDTSGTISSNPAQQAYASIFACADFPTEDPAAITTWIQMDFIVEWQGPLQMNQS